MKKNYTLFGLLFFSIFYLNTLNAQNVGIGTASPTSKLDIAGDLRINDNDLYLRTGTDLNHGIGWYGTGKLWNSINVDGPVLYGFSSGILGTNQSGTRTNVLYWNTQNVGIGTTSTTARLHVNGSVRFQGLGSGTESTGLMMDGSGNLSSRTLNISNWDAAFGWGNHAVAGYLTSFTEVDPTWDGAANTTGNIGRIGNVGIGTSTPIQKLDVNGRVNISNGVIQRGGTAITGTSDLGLYSRVNGNWIRFVTNNAPFHWFTDDGVGSTSRMELDASGNLRVPTGYLTVGNPTVPTGVSTTLWNFVYWEEFDNYSYWTQSTCRGSNSFYIPFFSGGFIYYEHENNDDDDYAYTPFIYIPASASPTQIRARWSLYVCMETGLDGMRAEISINGNSWTRVNPSNFVSGGYNSNADDECGAGPFQSAWSNSSGVYFTPELDLDAQGVRPGDWIRIRLEASTDGSLESCWTDIEVYWFTVEVVNQTNANAFETGGIYAAGHIFAHSNSHVGDVAEYFPVEGFSSPGDVIAMIPDRPDLFKVSDRAYNPYAIGVYSTNPSVLVNSPEAGKPVGLSGRVPVKVSGKNGKIRIGDYLTTSEIKGHAMKADKNCYTIGRALESFEGENGTVMCLIEPGWYNPSSSSNTGGGTFEIRAGNSSVLINDPSMRRDSRVFISLLGNPDATYWISEKQNGMFRLSFSNSLKANLQFDYFIDNANAPDYLADASQNGIVNPSENLPKNQEDVLIAQGKNPTTKESEIDDSKGKNHPQHGNSKPLKEYIPSEWPLPAIPPDQGTGWIWHPDFGYVRTGQN